MPPRGNPDRGRGRGRGGGGGDGGGRGGLPRGAPPRGGPPRGSGGRGGPALRGGPAPSGGLQLPSHVEAIGVKRPGHGNAGRPLEVITNHFTTSIPEDSIHHYDVIGGGSELTLPILFSPRGVYDGRKNFFTAQKLSFGEGAEFDVSLSDAAPASTGQQQQAQGERRRGPKIHKVRITHVAEINPEVLSRFLDGLQSNDERVLTAITALNVVVRMQPSLTYPFNVRSFFTPTETQDIGSGIVLWRGYFQSVRPSPRQMLINIDISTGAMYKPGPLLALCLAFLNQNNPNALAPKNKFPERERIRLQRFVSTMRVVANYPQKGATRPSGYPRTLKRLTKDGARDLSFEVEGGRMMTVAEYFQNVLNRPLRYPDAICAELSKKAIIPLELLDVPPGQIIKKQIPSEKTSDVLAFSSKKPQDRLQSIKNGLDVLAYGQSEYLRQFKMQVSPEALKINARVLVPPTLKYGAQSKQPTIVPRDGAWNMIDKRVFQPCSRVDHWVVVIYEQQRKFNDRNVDDMVNGLMSACVTVGIQMPQVPAIVRWESGQGVIGDVQILSILWFAVGSACKQKTNNFPTLIVVILPEGGNDIYSAVKHFGDVTAGVVTQCMKSSKCFRAKMQYYANVTLKLNVKLGGINTIPDAKSASILYDPSNPTIVMGADVMHPAPGSQDRPSFAALVSSVDSDNAKYIATMDVQTSKEDIIENLQNMVKYVLEMYLQYRQNAEKKTGPAPKRIIFYRDGTSEGRFKEVLDRDACKELGVSPKITFVVVGKRHHVRFFPKNEREGDRSGNCPAGTVVDREVVNPVEFDYYLQSHGGLLGTSRPSHYNVLYDENNFTPDGLQSLSFALCHVYARSTRSVSIPAPVYYADIVCSRAKHHYDPQQGLELSLSDTVSNTEEQASTLNRFKAGFKVLNPKMRRLMYFC
ncbi:hypothetical protein EW146_g2726 [Bondarzewia mesenterica]|uniref:Piwi domain-containing protein n=1 Tax=Bondarzewia mesenterica TaxID=1095465 RepID=A0A4V3XFP2_9AGAM|nr:hypothetical protein EW146_g2726 [Bondarzewia mesenterica]